MSYLSQQVITLQAYTASMITANVPVPTVTMIEAVLRITAASGTTPTLNVWLESSPDAGINWYPMAYDQQITLGALGTDVAGNTNRIMINGTASAVAAGTHRATYKHVPGDLVRGRTIIGGTTPSFTFELWLKGK